MIGQRESIKHFVQEVHQNKVSHAHILSGKNGYNGLALALSVAQFLMCENRGESDSCGECSSCTKAAKLEHPDLHFAFPVVQSIDKKSDTFIAQWREHVLKNPTFSLESWSSYIDPKRRVPVIGVEQSQEIIRKLSVRSFEGGYKVMFIFGADSMNTAAANKLLKIIEEPPAKTIFLLVCEDLEQILPTIRSRAQSWRLSPIDLDELTTYIQRKHALSLSLSESIAARSDGDLLQAEELVSAIEEGDKNKELFIKLMRVCYKKNVIDMVSWAEEIAAQSKYVQKDFLDYSLYMFRQSMLRNYTGNQMTRVSQDEDDFLKNFARFITGNNLPDFLDKFSKAQYHLDRNAHKEILFTDLCFHVMRYIHAA